jgi:hypothetical protein
MADGLECMRPLRGMLRTIDTLTAGGVPWLLDRPRRHADEEAGAARSYWDVTVTAGSHRSGTPTTFSATAQRGLRCTVCLRVPQSLHVTLRRHWLSGSSHWLKRPFVGFGCGGTEGPNHTRSECSLYSAVAVDSAGLPAAPMALLVGSLPAA